MKELSAAKNAPNNGNKDNMYDIGENININPNNLIIINKITIANQPLSLRRLVFI